MPGSEYDLELRLAYGSGASIGVGTHLRLTVPASGAGDGVAVAGEPLLQLSPTPAFGGFQFEVAEGALEVLLARDLMCEWELVEH